MSELSVRKDWLKEHGTTFPKWASLMLLFTYTNSYAVVPAKYGSKDGGVEDCDILVYEVGVKGQPAAFRATDDGKVVCVNYPGSRPMTSDQFVDFVDDIMRNGKADDKQLGRVLAKA